MKQNIMKTWVNEPLNKVVVENHMASLCIENTEEKGVTLEGLLNLEEPFEEFDPQDYYAGKFNDGVLSINLDEVEAMSNRKGSILKLYVPKGVELQVETDNYPISATNYIGKMKITSENAAVSINNCEGDKHIESENGPVRMHQCRGNIFATLENGPFSAEAITGESIHLSSENGPLKVRLANFNSVELETENGPIYFETQPVDNGEFKFKTENGIVHLVLPLNFDFELKATTESGRVKSNLNLPLNNDGDVYTMINGTGSNKIEVSTENGIIKLSNDGHLNLDFVKDKLEQLKTAFKNANTSEEKDKVMDMLNKVIEYLNRAVSSISEDTVKEKVNAAILKLKVIGDKFDFNETKEKVIVNIEDIGQQIHDGLKEGIKDFRSGFEDVKQRHFRGDLHDYIRKVMDSPLIKPYLGGDKKTKEKEEIADRSRLKILEMLEAGKITPEEAERLLKAIGKE